jgi:pimeloyl-ACP methyl ester carboxylesterase
MSIARQAPVLLALALVLAACRGGTAPSERQVDIGSHRLHLRSEGGGSPVVVIDAGLTDSLDKLRPLQARLARQTRVITYDRAGYGRSEPGPLPRDAGREATELRAMLGQAAVPGPYVLVGHSLGALNAQLFAAKYPADVAGLILLDPPPLTFLLRQEYADLAALAEKMTAEWQGIADSALAAGGKDGQARAVFFRAIASEHREMFAASAQAAAAIRDFGSIPLVVVAAGKPNPAFGAIAEEYQKYWIEQNRLLAAKSSRGRFVLADRSSHYLYLDDPDLVEDAVVSLVRRLRAK